MRCVSAWSKRDKSKRAALKAVVMDRTLPVEDRFNATLKLAQLPRNGAAVRVRLRCAITGRSRGNYRKFKLCRIALRELASVRADPRHGQGKLVRGHAMSMSDPLGDMLTRIRNAQRARHRSAWRRRRKLRANVLDVLKREGFIRGFAAEELRPGVAQLRIELKYDEGEPVIKEITRISKPGRRVYSKIKELPRVYAGLGVSILSTPRGVMSDAEARAANVGGEVLCRVF